MVKTAPFKYGKVLHKYNNPQGPVLYYTSI